MGESLELVISRPQDEQFLKKIEWNQKEFMALIASMTKKYKGLIYTEDDISTVKKDRAYLNGMKKAISDRRIQVKKAVMNPYEQFEKEVKEVVGLIDEPLAIIDKTIKDSEENARQEKKKALQAFFDESVGELSGILMFDRVFSQRMLNATCALSKAKGEITDAIRRVETDMRSIDGLVDEKYRLQAKDYYCRTLNVSGTMSEVRRLTELDRKLEEQRERERIRQEEEAARKAEAEAQAAIMKSEPERAESGTERAESGTEPVETVSEPVETVSEPVETVSAPAVNAFAQAAMAAQEPQPKAEPAKLYKARFCAIGTKEQLVALRQYMEDNKIEFRKEV